MDIKGAALLLGGLTAGLLIGRLPLWGEEAAALAPRAAATAPAETSIRASADAGTARAEASSAATIPKEDADEDVSAAAGVTLYGPDGEYACDPACIETMTDGFLAGRLSEDDASAIYGALAEVADAIASDRDRRRRFLTLLTGMTYDWEESSSTTEQVAVNIATLYGLPDGFAGDIQRAMEGASDPAVRALGLTVAMNRDAPGEAKRAVERALMREQDPAALSAVLGHAAGVQEPLSASALSAIRTMADGHADVEVRGSAFYALIYGAEPTEGGRTGLIERGLGDPEPMIRMAALSAATDGRAGALGEGEVARYREMATAVANDADADVELRMHALSLLSWGALAEEGEDTYTMRLHH